MDQSLRERGAVDSLTCLFLPMMDRFVSCLEQFNYPVVFGLTVFGLLQPLDTFLYQSGLLHSWVTINGIQPTNRYAQSTRREH